MAAMETIDGLKELWRCVTWQGALFLTAWLLGCVAVIYVADRTFGRWTRRHVYGPLAEKLGMKPCCPCCDNIIPEPRPEACPKCETKLSSRRFTANKS